MNSPMNENDLELFKAMTVFLVKIPGVSGIVKLREENVPESIRAKMPKELFSLDARVFDPAAVRKPATLRTRLSRKLNRLGTSFLSGFLISDEDLAEARNEVEEMRREYESWVSPFLNEIDPLINAQCAKFPEWEEIIRNAAPTREEVEARLKFAMKTFKIQPGDEEDKRELSRTLTELPGQIANDFAQLVKEAWTSMEGEQTKQKFRTVIASIRRKAKSMSYLDPKLSSLVSLIDEVVAQLPETGSISGPEYALLRGLREMLLDPREILGMQRIAVRPTGAPTVAFLDGAANTIPSAQLVEPLPKTGESPIESIPANEPALPGMQWVF